MIYPTFLVTEERGFIPRIYLPRNYKTLLFKFHEQERKEGIADYIRQVRKLNSSYTKIRTNLDTEKGLVNISLGTTGLDFCEQGWPNFQKHNLEGINSFIAGAIAMRYVSELLRSEAQKLQITI